MKRVIEVTWEDLREGNGARRNIDMRPKHFKLTLTQIEHADEIRMYPNADAKVPFILKKGDMKVKDLVKLNRENCPA